MDVMTTARNIGLIAADGGSVFGTIEQHVVIEALDELAITDIADADLFAGAIAAVKASRSAGVEKLGATSFLGRTDSKGEIQLSYRAAMADIFLDLAIDLGLRHSVPSERTAVV
ncbi:MAG: hypothetical protein JWM34_3833 [Ilumatobacteraceae bacterium]|nr:hypothetical protein [Ilumatobacteraceae bacterium]